MVIHGYPVEYIVWNIFLGLVPFFLCSLAITHFRKNDFGSKLLAFLSLIAWLFFMPNAPYIISDVRHINGFCPDTILDICLPNAWLIFFFFIFALIGWPLYFYALEQMRVGLIEKFYPRLSVFFPLLISPLIALGLLLGLIDRLNSWDVLTRPWLVLAKALAYFYSPIGLWNLVFSSFSLLILYYCAKLLFRPIRSFKAFKKL